MAKDDAQRIAIEAARAAAWRSASDRKDHFFEQKVNGQNIWLEKPNSDQIQKLVAWGANSVSPDLQKSTVFSVYNSEPQPRALWQAVLKGGVVMNEGLLEAESAVFSIGFCKPAVKKKIKIHFSPELCEKKSNVQKFLQDHCNRGTNSWETSALTSAHMVLCLESEKNTFKKKGRTVKTDREFLDMLLSSHRDEKQCARSA